MGDISIIARRLADGHVQYGWSGNGGYFRSVGLRLLAWYDDPEMVEYLFGLGQLSTLGQPGSGQGGSSVLTGRPHYLGTTEREIFSRIAFIDYGYFYDTDRRWYYVKPGPFCIKIPLMNIYHATNGGKEREYEYLREIQREIVRYMFGDYAAGDEAFAVLLEENQINPGEIIAELEKSYIPLYDLYDRYGKVYSYFDDWILAVAEDDDRKIVRYVIKPETEKHIETIKWG